MDLVTVYFDGLCRLCSREIDHYRRMRGAENLRFVDITDPRFDARAEGVDPQRVHQVMHVRDRDGQLRTGVDAFICIWGELPAMRHLVPIAQWRPASWALKGVYSVFAKVRPLLPRKSCEDSPYCANPRVP